MIKSYDNREMKNKRIKNTSTNLFIPGCWQANCWTVEGIIYGWDVVAVIIIKIFRKLVTVGRLCTKTVDGIFDETCWN